MEPNKKNEELISQMVKECHTRLEAAKTDIDGGHYDSATNMLHSVTTLLNSLRILDM